jgi:hypothetical protein
MSQAAMEHEPLPVITTEPDPSRTGGATLRLAESAAYLDEFAARLMPHESLGVQNLQHEREIIRRINAGLPEDSEHYRTSNLPPTRIRNYISQEVDTLVLIEDELHEARRSRRLIINYDEAVARLRDRLAQDHPARQVFRDYETAAKRLTKPRSEERLLSDGDIRMHIFWTLTLLDEKAVREEIDREVFEAKEKAGR